MLQNVSILFFYMVTSIVRYIMGILSQILNRQQSSHRVVGCSFQILKDIGQLVLEVLVIVLQKKNAVLCNPIISVRHTTTELHLPLSFAWKTLASQRNTFLPFSTSSSTTTTRIWSTYTVLHLFAI